MKARMTAAIVLVGLLMSLVGCSRTWVERKKITREGSFDLEEALDLQRATYEPVYEVIMGSYTEEGPMDERFATREETVAFLVSAAFAPYAAEQIAEAFFDADGHRRWDSFLPTIYHEGVTIVDAYFERVTFHYHDNLYLVIEERYSERDVGELRTRRSLYIQDPDGQWKYHMADGLQCISGPGYCAHGRRSLP